MGCSFLTKNLFENCGDDSQPAVLIITVMISSVIVASNSCLRDMHESTNG